MNLSHTMDERVWNRLPHDIVERVLAFLPVIDLMRCRCVCKLWNSFLSARRPLEVVPTEQSYLLCLTTVGSPLQSIHVFNILLCKWKVLSLSFLPPELVDISVVKSSGGLLYLQAMRVGGTVYVTCNPVTKTWRELPSMFSKQIDRVPIGLSTLTAMATNSNPEARGYGTYKIVETGPNGTTDLSTRIFDSATGSWIVVGKLPSGVTGFESEGVIIDKCLYGVTFSPSKLLKMELQGSDCEWSELCAGMPPFAVYPHLVECSGSLVMVAGFDPCWDEGEIADPTALKIWKLDHRAMRWEAISKLPEDMYEDYVSRDCSSLDSLKCAAQGAKIFVANYDGSVVVVYDLEKGSWSRLPDCQALSNHQFCVDKMFIFHPSVQMLV